MHKLEWEPEGVYWKYQGDVVGKEIIEASTSIYGDPRFDDLNYKLVDFMDVESILIDVNEVATIAYQHKAAAISNPYIKTAIVIKDENKKIALSFASFFEDSIWEVEIFQDLDEACHWVGR